MNAEELNLITLAQRFSDEDTARAYLEDLRWPDGKPVCPFCGHEGGRVNRKPSAGRKAQKGVCKCKNRECRKQFTVTKGTVFESSHVGINLWVMCMFIMCSSKKAVSAHQIHRMLGVTYKTAWFMCHRIRYAMTEGALGDLMDGIIEVDETYIGGKPRPGDGKKRKRGRGTDKMPVMVLVERGGRAKSRPMKRLTGKNLKKEIIENVDESAAIMTDEYGAYVGLDRHFSGGHHTVNHGAGEYVRDGIVHSNTAESFFALFKRGIVGAFHHVSDKHLHRYCAEFDYRWSNRKITDGERTEKALSMIEGKRLLYRDSFAPAV